MDAYTSDILRRAECGMTNYVDALRLRAYIETLEAQLAYIETLEARLAKFDGPGRVHRIVFAVDRQEGEQHETSHS